MAHIQKRSNGRYRVRYRDPQKKERSKTFDRRVDPRSAEIFYVGKGTSERLLHHGREADFAADGRAGSAKVRRIREIRASGMEARHDVVRQGLSEPEALLVEAAGRV